MTVLGKAYAFPTLLDGTSQTFTVIGTGLSHPDCPTSEELKKVVPLAVMKLGLPSPSPCVEEKSFDIFSWAGETLGFLRSLGRDENVVRYELASALGLLDDPRWFGRVGLPLRGNTPRHRAIARLVVEGCFSGFYCLNWDALLERTLESVGLEEIRQSSDKPPTGRPMKLTAYARVIHSGQQSKVANNRVFPLYKPHGCVEELRANCSQQIVFKITTTDLQQQPAAEQSFINGQVSTLAGGKPILGIGWKADEEYLRNAIIAAPPAPIEDAFILASRSWYTCSHGLIAQSRGSNMLQAHAALGRDGQPTTDTLLPWLYARYALRKLENAAELHDRQRIKDLYQHLDDPSNAVKPHKLTTWCDDWLPSWVRLCWQVGAMEGCDPATNQEVKPHDIPLGPPDLHIPLSDISVKRKDLKAAARLLATLSTQGHYDYSTFPGALWDCKALHLILPLPVWGEMTQFNDLAGLKSLFSALRQHGLGKVRKVSLIALSFDDANPVDDAVRKQLAALVAKRLPYSQYAYSQKLDWLELTDLKGETHD